MGPKEVVVPVSNQELCFRTACDSLAATGSYEFDVINVRGEQGVWHPQIFHELVSKSSVCLQNR